MRSAAWVTPADRKDGTVEGLGLYSTQG